MNGAGASIIVVNFDRRYRRGVMTSAQRESRGWALYCQAHTLEQTDPSANEKHLALYQSAVVHDPELADAWANLGACFCLRTPTAEEQAFVCFERALSIAPRHVPALHNRAWLHLERNQPQQAVIDLWAALEANERIAYEVQSHVLLAQTLESQGDWGSACDVWEAYLSWLDPEKEAERQGIVQKVNRFRMQEGRPPLRGV